MKLGLSKFFSFLIGIRRLWGKDIRIKPRLLSTIFSGIKKRVQGQRVFVHGKEETVNPYKVLALHCIRHKLISFRSPWGRFYRLF